MNILHEVKKYVGQIIELSLLLIALGIVVEILFGSAVPFVGGVVANLVGLIENLGQSGYAGLIALGVILYLLSNKEKIIA
jgi:phosphotransferase system  glucose/maltose/N-acetylglucosamine-specific IIC component